MSDLLSLNTTDLGLSYFSFSDFGEASKTKQNLVLNIASLDRNTPKMFELLGELLTGELKEKIIKEVNKFIFRAEFQRCQTYQKPSEELKFGKIFGFG